jgi:hypothetical protein
MEIMTNISFLTPKIDIMFHIFPHLLPLSMCNLYNVLFHCNFVFYGVLFSFLFLAFVFVVAASETFAVFILILA